MSSPSQAFTGWVLPPGSGLQLVSSLSLAGVQNATIGGLDGDADGFYFIVGQMQVGSIGPSVRVTFSPNGAMTNILPVVNGYADDGLIYQRPPPPSGVDMWPIHGPQSIVNGAQVMFQGVIGASSVLYPNSWRTWSGSSITQSLIPAVQVTTANLGGIWTAASAGNNLTSLVFDAQPAFTATMTGVISLFKFG